MADWQDYQSRTVTFSSPTVTKAVANFVGDVAHGLIGDISNGIAVGISQGPAAGVAPSPSPRSGR